MLDDPRLRPLIAKLPGPFPRWAEWLRTPAAKWVRIPIGVLFILGGLVWFLPIVGLWMLPLGVLLIAQDIPFLQRMCQHVLDWVERRHPRWLRK